MVNKVSKTAQGKIQSLNKQLTEMEILHQMKEYLEFTMKTIESESNSIVMCMKNPITDCGQSLVERFDQTHVSHYNAR